LRNSKIILIFAIQLKNTNMVEGLKNINGKICHLFITFCDDIGVNKGGYFCQVYDKELEGQEEIDYFTISKEDVKKNNGLSVIMDYLDMGILSNSFFS